MLCIALSACNMVAAAGADSQDAAVWHVAHRRLRVDGGRGRRTDPPPCNFAYLQLSARYVGQLLLEPLSNFV